MQPSLLTRAASALLFLTLSACASTKGGDPSRSYPLDTCIVTDNALGSMGDPITRVYNGQEIKFCCQPCVEEFEADPDAFLAKLPK
ncbi:MAG: hypothetical protein R3F49_00945 [Planctomycetota bacterium]